MLRRLTGALYSAAVALIAVALAVMVLVVAYQILGRYLPFLSRALWTEEIARMCLIWLVFLGAAVGVRTSEHFLIDLIPKRISDRAQRVIITLGLALVTVVAVVLFIGSLSFVETGTGRTSTTSGLSLVYSFTAPLVSAVLMVLFSIESWWEGMRRPEKGGLRLDEDALVEPITTRDTTNDGTAGGESR
ncbi:TRAP transporter small permease [Pseudactinotalea sp. Z1748]|uniref:TRAP transporter small permease n=1 Tax=Pseudactinotalea sp. Z1748 TaxID=3413027 RepID=UPI003C7ECCA2